ncbi:hypothetical protein C8Q69DRAFT_520904 [Paecilomyces variotii]|uniref:Glutamine repeat protein-1 n=1 Tax=Byssochlamys spectabilis TaxID=264951 RepID=A0A443HVT2_BYSSP|nr:hypothetical protein C8Q69DRAFT_520904 [Paecilomyces variotii]KAJ9276823.1 hypothetical protein DTO021D3_6260 [Paecilomyces variotii]KAJ9358418.1 hypothetical protein DTO280E4_5177 [Paecilomyces variotii]KAJ9380697.1 hypothetical protein DTO032I4_6518 [Paecilomyces variotii]RWQ95844.1 hypothetical protein C8Q69DRAFT_520904 [Paecilomyces variotii]
MNPNPTGYPAFQQHPNPMLSAPAGYPVPSQSPNSHQVPFYANPAAYSQIKAPQGHPMQQQPQQHPFGAVQLQTTGPAGAMMPAGIPQQISGRNAVARLQRFWRRVLCCFAPSGPSHLFLLLLHASCALGDDQLTGSALSLAAAGPHANFPTVSAPSPYTPSTVPATPSQSSQPRTVSGLPASTAQGTPPNMAAVSTPNNMFAGQQRPVQQPSPTAASSPQSAAAQAQVAARDRARVHLLLDINSALLQEVVSLQAAGKAGLPPTQPQNSESPNQGSENDAQKGQATKPSQEYIDCMRRLQANLAYLASITDKAKKAAGVLPSAPAIMTPPPSLPSLNNMYAQLAELFPGASTAQQQQQQQQQKHGYRLSQGNGGPSPASMAESVV